MFYHGCQHNFEYRANYIMSFFSYILQLLNSKHVFRGDVKIQVVATATVPEGSQTFRT